MRDASFTLYALMRLGFNEEAGHFMSWLEERCRELKPDDSLQPMYAIAGNHMLTEEILSNLKGYKNSRPVGIGNSGSTSTASCWIRYTSITSMARRFPMISGAI